MIYWKELALNLLMSIKFPALALYYQLEKYPMQVKDSSKPHDDSLRGLRGAVFVANAMVNSKSKKWIVDKFHGDEQLVDMWSLFVRSNGWIEKNHPIRGWKLTEKGRFWFKSIMSSVAGFVLTLFSSTSDIDVSQLIVT